MAERRTPSVRPWVWALGALIAVLLILLALVIGPWLFTRHPQKGLTAEQALKAKNDVRTTLVQALAGLAVAGGLAVTYSTYRQNQRDQADRRAEQDRSHRLSVARHVNDLYTKAVEQLGHDQAPVRLGALYSLVHLAQANPEQRQTVVNVLCAYLRMPYSQPEDLPTSATRAEQRDASQELQVRLTAQRLLADHLRAPKGVSGEEAQHLSDSPDESFWPRIDLDLTGAVLIDFHLSRASVGLAIFDKTVFSGSTSFNDTTFNSIAWFSDASFTAPAAFYDATFTKYARFDGAVFGGATRFAEATFRDNASFNDAVFSAEAKFDSVTFTGYASFKKVTMSGSASFAKATFNGDTSLFSGATFGGETVFVLATFNGDTSFVEATFNGYVGFNEATFGTEALFARVNFNGDVWLPKAAFGGHTPFVLTTFAGAAWFAEATFVGATSFGQARVLHLDNPGLNKHRVWPDGWTVRPDADDPTRGTLIREEQAEQPGLDGGGTTP